MHREEEKARTTKVGEAAKMESDMRKKLNNLCECLKEEQSALDATKAKREQLEANMNELFQLQAAAKADVAQANVRPLGLG